jgi:parvulin-like peptidyl-prolyl isomerase
LASACSSAQPKSAAALDDGAKSAGAQCLDDANAPRTPPPGAPDRIEVRQILVRHRELARPDGATETREQACLLALEALQQLQGGADWAVVVEKFSDASSDDLGRVSRDELSPAFADAAFELGSGELSYVVESDRGFHVILRK